jgi:hypothetical protein
MGGAIPPVIWDGVVTYTRPGSSTPTTEPVHLSIADGPVANLNLRVQGTPYSAGQPAVTPTLNEGAIAEPKPVVIAQAMH